MTQVITDQEDNYRKILIKGIKILSCTLRKKNSNRLVSHRDIVMTLVCIQNFEKNSLSQLHCTQPETCKLC